MVESDGSGSSENHDAGAAAPYFDGVRLAEPLPDHGNYSIPETDAEAADYLRRKASSDPESKALLAMLDLGGPKVASSEDALFSVTKAMPDVISRLHRGER